MTALLSGLGVALPPSTAQDEIWEGYFAQHYEGARKTLARRIFANAGVRTRQAAVNPLLEDVSGWSTERRMRRYQVEAIPLGKAAVSRAAHSGGHSPMSLAARNSVATVNRTTLPRSWRRISSESTM